MGKKIIIYYPDARGHASTLDYLIALPPDDRQKAFAYISYLEEQGEELRRPVAAHLGQKLYELRPKQIRILYAFVGKEIAVILRAFRKKTEMVPANEEQLARARLADFTQRYQQGLIRV